jgi:hypothetical protein
MKDMVIMTDIKNNSSLTSALITVEQQMGFKESPTVSQELPHAHL